MRRLSTIIALMLLTVGCLPKKLAKGLSGNSGGGDEASGPDSDDDTPEKPAPIAGAYLTCVITKSSPEAVIAGCQARTKDRRRIADQDIDKGRWSFILPKGETKDPYEVSLVKLSKAGKRHYYHSILKIKPRRTPHAGLSLTQKSLAGFAARIRPVYVFDQSLASAGLHLTNQSLGIVGLGLYTNTILASRADAGSPIAVTRAASTDAALTIGRHGEPGPSILPPEGQDEVLDPVASASGVRLLDTVLIPRPVLASVPEIRDDAASDVVVPNTWTAENNEVGTQNVPLLPENGAFVVDSDGDGIPDEIDQCPNTQAGQEVDRDRESHNFGCSIHDPEFQPLPPP